MCNIAGGLYLSVLSVLSALAALAPLSALSALAVLSALAPSLIPRAFIKLSGREASG